MKIIDDIIANIGLFILFINCVLFLKSYNSKTSKALTFFTLYLAISFLILTINIILARNGITNLYLSHFYFISQFVLLSLFYKQLFSKNQNKIVNSISVIVFLLLAIQYIKTPSLYYRFNLFEIFITSFPIIIYSIIHLYNSLTKEGKYMYINAGILVYLTTSTLIFILGNVLSSFDRQTTVNIWLINKILYIVYLVLILFEWKKTVSQVKNK